MGLQGVMAALSSGGSGFEVLSSGGSGFDFEFCGFRV